MIQVISSSSNYSKNTSEIIPSDDLNFWVHLMHKYRNVDKPSEFTNQAE
ncbi:2570_t:CDS:1, partial [Racocetra persica]